MATNQQAINSAAINSAQAGRLLVGCVIAATAVASAPPTHNHRVTVTAVDIAILETKVDQTHSITQGIFADTHGFAQEQVYRLPTAFGFAHAEIHALARAADGGAEFEAFAVVDANLNTLRAIHSVVSSTATGYVDDAKIRRILLSELDNATATARIASGYMVTHAGASNPIHYDAIRTVAVADISFAPGGVRISSSPWRPFAGAVFEAQSGYTYSATINVQAGTATVWAHPSWQYLATVNATTQVNFVESAVRTTFGTAQLPSETMVIVANVFQKHAITRPKVLAEASLSEANTVRRSGGYVHLIAQAGVSGCQTLVTRHALSQGEATGTMHSSAFTRRFHFAEANALNDIQTLGYATILGYDIATFERPREPSEFSRGAELKEFTRARL